MDMGERSRWKSREGADDFSEEDWRRLLAHLGGLGRTDRRTPAGVPKMLLRQQFCCGRMNDERRRPPNLRVCRWIARETPV